MSKSVLHIISKDGACSDYKEYQNSFVLTPSILEMLFLKYLNYSDIILHGDYNALAEELDKKGQLCDKIMHNFFGCGDFFLAKDIPIIIKTIEEYLKKSLTDENYATCFNIADTNRAHEIIIDLRRILATKSEDECYMIAFSANNSTAYIGNLFSKDGEDLKTIYYKITDDPQHFDDNETVCTIDDGKINYNDPSIFFWYK